MAKKTTKKPAINYTSREFATIKDDLVNYARRYYPERFRDFSANSFGSLMLDTVAYVGDMLSFYLDYQVNESTLATALEFNNILKLAKHSGYKPELYPSSYGMLTCFILIPSTNGAPDFTYAPIIKRGSKFSTSIGEKFTLLEDINFRDEDQNEIVIGDVNNETGAPLNYAVRAKGQAVSGELALVNITVGAYEKFLKIPITAENITEIISVTDSAGNAYFEVDYLTQNTIYFPYTNHGGDKKTVASIMKPIAVPRRYTVMKEPGAVYLQFGFGTDEDMSKVLDPSKMLLETHGKEYNADASFDPAILQKTNTLGIVPSDTTLTVVYRVNSAANTNAATNTITIVSDPLLDFDNQNTLDSIKVQTVRNSLEVTNEEAFVGSQRLPSAEEVKQRALGAYAMQNRMVTKEDFVAATLNMPAKFGKVKKVGVAQDSDSFNQRNINLYVVSSDIEGYYEKTNETIKNNLKTHLSRYKMINDSIDILDAKIINLRIDFKIQAFENINKFAALDDAKDTLVSFFNDRIGYDIAEPFSISDIFSLLKATPTVLDVLDVDVSLVTGADYADSNFQVDEARNNENTKIYCPLDSVFEIKYPNANIIGTVV